MKLKDILKNVMFQKVEQEVNMMMEIKFQMQELNKVYLFDVKSPNIWPVKYRIGEEKQTALLLMRKYLALENNEKVNKKINSFNKTNFDYLKALQIKSVVIKEGDCGYIYIEAFKSYHVKAACEDIRSLNLSHLHMVPIKGMIDIL
jgi:transcription elongation factor SPT5